jgi:hypothetical protein
METSCLLRSQEDDLHSEEKQKCAALAARPAARAPRAATPPLRRRAARQIPVASIDRGASDPSSWRDRTQKNIELAQISQQVSRALCIATISGAKVRCVVISAGSTMSAVGLLNL